MVEIPVLFIHLLVMKSFSITDLSLVFLNIDIDHTFKSQNTYPYLYFAGQLCVLIVSINMKAEHKRKE